MRKALLWGDVAFFVVLAAVVVWRAHWTARSWIGLGWLSPVLHAGTVARLQLGQSFRVGAKARVLVSTGLYSKFRHPLYLFGFFAYLGVFLIWGKWILLVRRR